MSRSYKHARPKKHRVYEIEDVLELFDISRNTLSNWVTNGLRPSAGKWRQIFQGAELIRYHNARRQSVSVTLRPGQFYCLGCKAPTPVLDQTTKSNLEGLAVALAGAQCPTCGKTVRKFQHDGNGDTGLDTPFPNTNVDEQDEAEDRISACIGKASGPLAPEIYFENDTIIKHWQIFARKYDVKTSDAHLHAIRGFERSIKGKSFGAVTVLDADAFRTDLIDRTKGSERGDGLSRSTAQHRASFLSKYFQWLIQQEGYTRLNKSLPDHFELPRGAIAQPVKQFLRAYPTTSDVGVIMSGMPVETRLERRDRAMVAMAFAFGLRASALVSLRCKHFDMDARTVFHDGTQIRAKNGKSFVIKAFPKQEAAVAIAASWYEEMSSYGLGPEDALFPAYNELVTDENLADVHPSIEPITTNLALSRAFSFASGLVGQAFSPHSARHYLAALGRSICRTADQKHAWSRNMGHEKEATIERYYGKMADGDRFMELDALSLPEVLSDEQTELVLDFYEHRLLRNSPEWREAKRLAELREHRDQSQEGEW